MPQARAGRLQRGKSHYGALGLLLLPRSRGPGPWEERDGDATPSPGVPRLSPRFSTFSSGTHPGLTRKRVELVPWSTAPTNGPKTAFFVAAMKLASVGGRANASRFPGDGGWWGRGGRRAQRAKRRAASERIICTKLLAPPLPLLDFLPGPPTTATGNVMSIHHVTHSAKPFTKQSAS